MKARPSVLPSGMKLVGDVRGEDDLVVLGTVEGELQVDGTVVVEESGTVQGNIRGRTIAIRGVVLGDALASDSIRVDAGGRVVGDLHAPRVNIVKGALFRGRVHMAEDELAVPMRRKRSRSRAGALRGRRAGAGPLGDKAGAGGTTSGVPATGTANDTLVETGAPTMVEAPAAHTLVAPGPPKPVLPVLRRTVARRLVRGGL